jgi:hypothetical protein
MAMANGHARLVRIGNKSRMGFLGKSSVGRTGRLLILQDAHGRTRARLRVDSGHQFVVSLPAGG